MTRKRTYRYIKAYAYFPDECKKRESFHTFWYLFFTIYLIPVRAYVVYNYNTMRRLKEYIEGGR